MTTGIDLVVHGPPGSAPPVLADAFLAAIREAGLDAGRNWRLLPMGDDPGVDAMNHLVTRPGDGTVVSTCTPVFLQAPLLRGLALTHRQLTPIARLVSDRYVLVARADAPFRTADAFLDHIRREPTRTGGYFLGGINHLLALAIADGAGARVDFVLTPSEPEVWTALMEGRIDWGVGVAAEILPHVEAGTLRPLATLDSARLPRFPDLPTLREAGLYVTFQLWRGLMGPPALDEAQRRDWHEIARTVTGTASWHRYLAQYAQTDAFLPGEEFCAFLDEQWDWYARHFRLAKLLPE